MILSLISQAFVLIILLTFSFGPAFFSLINTGIKYGYKTGAFLATGVVLSDFFLCILVCLLVHFGMSNLLHSPQAQTFSAIIGGIILIVFGAFFFKKHSVKTDNTIDIENKLPSPSVMIIKGFFFSIYLTLQYGYYGLLMSLPSVKHLTTPYLKCFCFLV